MTLSSLSARPQSFKTTGRRRFAISCIVILMAFLTILVGSTRLTAQDVKIADDGSLAPIANFINGQTLLVARLDLDGIDLNRFKETLDVDFLHLLTSLGFSKDSSDSTMVEFGKTSESLKEKLAAQIEGFKEARGFSKAYFVVQSTDGKGTCVIAPIGSATPEQVKEAKEGAEKVGLNCGVYQKKYLIASSSPLKEIGAFYKNFQSAPNPKIEKFFKDNSDKTLAFYSGRLKIRPFFKDNDPNASGVPQTTEQNESTRNTGKETIAESEARLSLLFGKEFGKAPRKKARDPFESFPRSVKDAIETFDASFVEAYGFVDLATLQGKLDATFTTSANAGRFKEEFAKIIAEVAPNYFDALQTLLTILGDAEASGVLTESYPQLKAIPVKFLERYRVIPVLRELCCGEMMARAPRQSEKELVFSFDILDEVKKIGPNTAASAFFFYALYQRAAGSNGSDDEVDESKYEEIFEE